MTIDNVSNNLHLPAALQGIFFPFLWDKQALWQLPTVPTAVSLSALEWHLDLPVWSTHPPNPLFNLRPCDVIDHPQLHAGHWARIQTADMNYPIDMFQNNGRWVIMDGYHRLARHVVHNSKSVLIRKHPDELLPLVQVIA